MTESERLIEKETEAIECLKSNKPTSGYVMLQESIDMAIKALKKQIPKKPRKTKKLLELKKSVKYQAMVPNAVQLFLIMAYPLIL